MPYLLVLFYCALISQPLQVVRKLQGAAAGSAMWATTVCNERGEVLMSVLTQSEGAPGLQRMAEGLMSRYERAG